MKIVDIALKGIGIAMGVAGIVTSILGKLDVKASITMLGFGLACAAISLLKNNTEGK